LANQLDDPEEPTIAELVHQLVEDARAFAQAEANLYKTIALHRLSQVKAGAILLAAGALLLLAASIALLVMVAIALATLIGPLAAGLVVALVASVAGWFLIRSGIGHVGAVLGDEEERSALQDKERRP
jgi:hypothetical protein